MPRLYFGSRGGVYYRKNGRKVYVRNHSSFGAEDTSQRRKDIVDCMIRNVSNGETLEDQFPVGMPLPKWGFMDKVRVFKKINSDILSGLDARRIFNKSKWIRGGDGEIRSFLGKIDHEIKEKVFTTRMPYNRNPISTNLKDGIAAEIRVIVVEQFLGPEVIMNKKVISDEKINTDRWWINYKCNYDYKGVYSDIRDDYVYP